MAVTVLWIIVLADLPSQRHARIRRAVWLTMLLLAAIGTLDLTPVGARLDAACGLPNVADLAQHLLAIVAATLARYCAVAIFGSARQRARWSAPRAVAVTAGTIAALAALFAASPARTSPTNSALYTDFPMARRRPGPATRTPTGTSPPGPIWTVRSACSASWPRTAPRSGWPPSASSAR